MSSTVSQAPNDLEIANRLCILWLTDALRNMAVEYFPMSVQCEDETAYDEKKPYVKEKYQKRKTSETNNDGFVEVAYKP